MCEHEVIRSSDLLKRTAQLVQDQQRESRYIASSALGISSNTPKNKNRGTSLLGSLPSLERDCIFAAPTVKANANFEMRIGLPLSEDSLYGSLLSGKEIGESSTGTALNLFRQLQTSSLTTSLYGIGSRDKSLSTFCNKVVLGNTRLEAANSMNSVEASSSGRPAFVVPVTEVECFSIPSYYYATDPVVDFSLLPNQEEVVPSELLELVYRKLNHCSHGY